jgi:hypothetical protein
MARKKAQPKKDPRTEIADRIAAQLTIIAEAQEQIDEARARLESITSDIEALNLAEDETP